MNSTILPRMLAFLMLSTLLIDQVYGDCCYPPGGYFIQYDLLKCKDGTPPTPYCGVGPCNAFGCNCVSGCRRNSNTTQNGNVHLERLEAENLADGSESGGTEFPKNIDRNGDGKLCLVEAHRLINSSFKFLIATTDQTPEKVHLNVKDVFDKMDLDFDGFLTLKEIDNASTKLMGEV